MAAAGDSLVIGGLPDGTNEELVQQIFAAYGDIKSVKMLPSQPGGKQSCAIRFGSVDEAKWIQENIDGNMPEGLTEPLQIKFLTSSAVQSIVKGKGSWKGGKESWSKGWSKDGGEKGDSWGPYAKGGKDFGGKGESKGKGKGKWLNPTSVSVKTLFDGLCNAGALPGGEKYENNEGALFVGALPPDTTDMDLYKIFSPFGAIAPQGVRAMQWWDTGACKGYGFVNFLDPLAAQTAISTLHGTQMGEDPQNTLVVMSKRLSGDKGDGKGEAP
mmetsp:Transcript_106732/g.166696  ORF Transcript_106732/g.166696 Transcript_106732/m.166696 type:complete len:271 (+) Transcript_106732:36-848(+)